MLVNNTGMVCVVMMILTTNHRPPIYETASPVSLAKILYPKVPVGKLPASTTMQVSVIAANNPELDEEAFLGALLPRGLMCGFRH